LKYNGYSKLICATTEAAKLNEKTVYWTLGKTGNPEFAPVIRLLQAWHDADREAAAPTRDTQVDHARFLEIAKF
jgi:hypothetical protein